ncbi:AAA family ATPase [Actinoplanes sp. TRM 88003]|uniref:AAA family ATPase n=1 Tax=Paractinoplanes aksuensis TaxID=2939490 RepID=A0ABT1DMD1_9ACTN|nr:AAA family ATPase [Actinoplanes aksuensis]MCO8271996.1 AAA family ATPase [Actinoplanes aksuensis]
MRLFGRESECATIDALLTGARRGRSASLVLRGEAGVGKTALLTYAVEATPDALCLSGIESEATFPFAALHRLLIPLLPQRDQLPAGQRVALEVACGLADGAPPDLYLVSLAALTLLAGAPRTCVVDDVQWLDQESLRSLAFVARRLHAEGVVLLFGLRGADHPELTGIPALDLTGLGREAGVALLGEVVGGPLDRLVAGSIVAATGGNPLALTDLGRELSTGELTGGIPLPDPMPIGSRLEAMYLARINGLPAATRIWLLLAAADPGGDPARLAAAAAALGISPDDAAPAETIRLVSVRRDVSFRHPLVRSAVYNGASAADRRRAHLALAGVTTDPQDADQRAWHRATAAMGPDDETAAELARVADRAGARGGHAARATFLVRAAELTGSPDARAGWLLAAAGAALQAGSPVRTLALLDTADDTALGPIGRGEALLIRAVAAVSTGDPEATRRASAMCLAAASSFAAEAPHRARAAVLQAAEHSISVESALHGTTQREIAVAARAGFGHFSRPGPPGPTPDDPHPTPSPDERPGPSPHAHPETGWGGQPGSDGPAPAPADLLLAAYASFFDGGYPESGPHLRRAVEAIGRAPDAEVLRHVVLGVTFCTLIWDDRTRRAILRRAEAHARATGGLQMLDLVVFLAAMTETSFGRLTEADRYDATGRRIRESIGATQDQEQIWRHPLLLAWRAGDGVPEALQGILPAAEALGFGAMVSIMRQSLALIAVGRGDYAAGLAQLSKLVELGTPGLYSRVLPDLVECALRAGDRRIAKLAYGDLAVAVRASGTPWARGLLARSRALLAAGESAEPHYREAIELMSGTLAVGDRARAHLLYGEWLRRRRRRGDAREQLSAALRLFESERAEAFAGRVRSELAALGGRVQNSVQENDTALTPQEAAVARLARAGGTNAEIAAHLYLSASTVDYHLRKVYRKLGVRSRRQLRENLHD